MLSGIWLQHELSWPACKTEAQLPSQSVALTSQSSVLQIQAHRGHSVAP